MERRKEITQFIFIVIIMLICIILRLMPGIKLSNVNETQSEGLKEEEFTRLTIDPKTLSKKVLKKVIIINDIIYDKLTNKDKHKTNKNALVSVVDGNVDKKLKELKNKHNYDQDEVSEKDLIISSKLKVKVK